MPLISLYKYYLPPSGAEQGIRNCTMTLEKGEVRIIEADSESDAHLFLRGLATLTYPMGGDYLFNGTRLNFSDYRNLLSAKKKIGYLASDTALISNRSILDNLTVEQAYFENNLTSGLSEEVLEMCREFSVEELIEHRPVNLGVKELKNVMVIREISKSPDVMLIQYPEGFAGAEEYQYMMNQLKKNIDSGMAMVYMSDDEVFKNRFPGKIVTINNGAVSV